MIKKLSIFITSFFVFFFLFLFLPSLTFASTFYLTPRATNIPIGSVVSVSVGINTGGESVNGVSAYLSYPSDKLEVAWISYGSAFSLQAEGSYGGGSIRISRGSIQGALGNINVATIGFRGKALGQATVSFVGGSAAPRTSNSSDSLDLGGSAGGTYTVGPAQAKSITLSKDQALKPVISSIVVSDISLKSVTISWATDKDSDSLVEYGLNSGKYYQQVSDKVFGKIHKITASENLIPGETFYFRVKSKDKSGNETVGDESTFRLKGYMIKIILQDSLNRPLADTQVTLYSAPQIGRTNQNGEVTFVDVSSGKHLVVAKLKNNFEVTREINVNEDPTISDYNLKIDVAEKGFDYSIVAGISVLVSLVLLGLLIIKKRKNKTQNIPPVNSSL